MGEWMVEKQQLNLRSAFNVRDVFHFALFRSVWVRLLLPYMFYVLFRWFRCVFSSFSVCMFLRFILFSFFV